MLSTFRSAAVVVFAAALSAAAANAQGLKIAIVNAQKAVADTQEIKKAQADLTNKYRARQQSLEALQSDIQNIQTQLRAPNMTPAKEQELTLDGQQKQKQLQRMNEDLQADFNQDRGDVLGRAGRRMQDVIKKLAEDRNLDVIVDVNNTLYFKPALELTAEATAAYDKAYPVGAATTTSSVK
jgi:outer membrane protein